MSTRLDERASAGQSATVSIDAVWHSQTTPARSRACRHVPSFDFVTADERSPPTPAWSVVTLLFLLPSPYFPKRDVPDGMGWDGKIDMCETKTTGSSLLFGMFTKQHTGRLSFLELGRAAAGGPGLVAREGGVVLAATSTCACVSLLCCCSFVPSTLQ